MSATETPATKSELLTRIARLEDNQVLEAGRYYFSRLVEARSHTQVEATIRQEVFDLGGDLDEFTASRENLAQDGNGVVELVRFLLRVGASGTELQRRDLSEALDGVGQRQILLETALVLGLATIVSLYHKHQTRGIDRTKKRLEFEITPDGQVKGTYEEEVINTSEASALGRYLGLLGSLLSPKTEN